MAVLSAIFLSILSAYYSIYGLGEIFSYNKESIYIMAGGLEFAKVVTALWLHSNWSRCNNIIKTYLSISVIVLMLITSMGIFGYLSRSHIEHSMKIQTSTSGSSFNLSNEIDYLNNQKQTLIDKRNSNIVNIERLQSTIDKGSEVNLKKGNLKGFDRSFGRERNEIAIYKKDNDRIDIELIKTNDDILNKTKRLNELVLERKKLEAELGPIRYIANFLYPSASEEYLEKSVTWLILILIFVFDPLAIILLIASTSSFMKKRLGRPPKKFSRIRKFKLSKLSLPKALNLSKFKFKTNK